jgi:cell division protease FtsH
VSADEARRDGSPSKPGAQGTRPGGTFLLVLLMSLLAYSVWSLLSQPVDTAPLVPYSEVLQLLRDSSVTVITLQGEQIQGVLRTERILRAADADPVRSSRFRSVRPPMEDVSFLPLVRKSGAQIEALAEAPFPWWRVLLLGLLPLAGFMVLWLVVLQRFRGAGEGVMAFGRSGARLFDRSKEKTTFDDVAGASGAKQELAEIVEFLKHPERFRRLGAEIPKGVLLMGPPGTGKTLLARAVAGEADVPFFSITGSDFMEMFVGIGPKRVRDLFQAAKDAAPSIIFIDELDAIGGRRGAGVWVGGADERERTLNQLLSEMSGFEPSASVIVLGATNRPDILDAALLRPGRFDRRIAVELPSQADRAQILRLHARMLTLAPDVDLDAVARGTPGFSGADLKNLLNEAALLAARREAEQITAEDLDEARDKVIMGLEREGLALTEREIRFLSFHEAGHAVLAAVLPLTDPLHKVTIVPRGRAMGITQQLPASDRYIYEREYMLDRITVMLGGRAAEQLMCDTLTTGAEDDLHQAVALARRMVLDWGMSDALGPMVAERSHEAAYMGDLQPEGRARSEETARKADDAVRGILDACYDRAKATLEEHREALGRVAARLREVEELTGDEVAALIEGEGRWVTQPQEAAVVALESVRKPSKV